MSVSRPQDSSTNQDPRAVSFVVTKNRTNSKHRVTEVQGPSENGEGGKNVMETQLDDSFRLVNKANIANRDARQVPWQSFFTRDLTEL